MQLLQTQHYPKSPAISALRCNQSPGLITRSMRAVDLHTTSPYISRLNLCGKFPMPNDLHMSAKAWPFEQARQSLKRLEGNAPLI